MKIKSDIENIFGSGQSLKIIRESARDFALQYIKPYVLDLSLIHISEPTRPR